MSYKNELEKLGLPKVRCRDFHHEDFKEGFLIIESTDDTCFGVLVVDDESLNPVTCEWFEYAHKIKGWSE